MQRRRRRIRPPAEEGQETAAGANQMLDPMQAAALAGFGFRSVQGKSHVNSGELVGGRRVDGQEAVAAKGAEIVERALSGKTHDEIGGGDVALEAD